MAISADLGLRNPAPEIYWHALHAHHMSPEETAMVGDSLPADVAGPQTLGMVAVWKPKAVVAEMIKEHFARYDTCLEQYNADHTTRPVVPIEEASAKPLLPDMFSTSLASALHHADYWYQFVSGRLQPEVVIEQIDNLLDVFRQAGKQ